MTTLRWFCCCTASPESFCLATWSPPEAQRQRAIAPWRAEPARLFAGRAAGPRRSPRTAEFDKLTGDALAIAAACRIRWPPLPSGRSKTTGAAASPGASPTSIPERLASLTVLSRPHPVAFNRAPLALPRWRAGEPLGASTRWFLSRTRCYRLLADDSRWLRGFSRPTSVPPKRSRAMWHSSATLQTMTRGARLEGIELAARSRSCSRCHQVAERCSHPGDADDTVGRARRRRHG